MSFAVQKVDPDIRFFGDWSARFWGGAFGVEFGRLHGTGLHRWKTEYGVDGVLIII